MYFHICFGPTREMRLTRVKQNDLVWENMSQDYSIDLVTVIKVFASHLTKYTSLVLLN